MECFPSQSNTAFLHALYTKINVDNVDLCVSSNSPNVLLSVIIVLCFCGHACAQMCKVQELRVVMS